MAKEYLKLGSIIEKRDRQTGEPVLDQNEQRTYYMKIDEDSVVTINGVRVTGIVSVSRPREKYDRKLRAYNDRLQKDQISEEEHEKKVSRYIGDGDLSYITFEITAAVDKK